LITLPRALARRLTSLCSKTFRLPRELLKRQAVRFLVDAQGLTVESATATHAVRFRDPAYRGLPQSWEAPLEAIQFLAKSAAKEGEFSLQGEAEVRLRLLEKTIPREEGFSTPDVVLETPASPKNGILLPPNARQTLIAAFETAEQGESGRYALQHVQLQGDKLALVATDGRQLLIQGGFDWPFKEDLLLGNYTKLFKSKEFPEGPLQFAKTERQFVFRGGNWEFFLPIEESQRYPKVEDVLPAASEAVAHLEISRGDAMYLREVLPHLPSDEFDYERPVTIELNGKIGIRSRSMKIPHGIEVVLRNSAWRGTELQCVMKRAYLQRALELGLKQFQFFSTGCAPVVVREGERTYCWATYHPDSIVKATSQTELRESPLEVKSVTNKSPHSQEKNSHAAAHASGASSAKDGSRRIDQRKLRNAGRTSRRTALWRWSDAAKAG
jgi:hypothetical protein